MTLRKACEHGRYVEHSPTRTPRKPSICPGGEFVDVGALTALVDEQAEDEGLWFMARTAPEAYLQQELRRLHALIETTFP